MILVKHITDELEQRRTHAVASLSDYPERRLSEGIRSHPMVTAQDLNTPVWRKTYKCRDNVNLTPGPPFSRRSAGDAGVRLPTSPRQAGRGRRAPSCRQNCGCAVLHRGVRRDPRARVLSPSGLQDHETDRNGSIFFIVNNQKKTAIPTADPHRIHDARGRRPDAACLRTRKVDRRRRRRTGCRPPVAVGGGLQVPQHPPECAGRIGL